MWSLDEAIVHYKGQGAPSDQSALISLFREVQQESHGRIPLHTLPQIARALGVKESYLLAVIKRIPSLRLANVHCLELCAGPNCSKHTSLAAIAEKIRREKSDKLTIKYVPCMRLCGKGPNVKWNGNIYHQADEVLIRSLIEEL